MAEAKVGGRFKAASKSLGLFKKQNKITNKSNQKAYKELQDLLKKFDSIEKLMELNAKSLSKLDPDSKDGELIAKALEKLGKLSPQESLRSSKRVD